MNSAQRKEDVRFTAEILAELRGVVNLVPDHSNKVNVTKKWIVHIFGFSVHKKVIFESAVIILVHGEAFYKFSLNLRAPK